LQIILANTLTTLGWNINHNPKVIKTIEGKIETANTKSRIILQSFSPESIVQLEKKLPNIPKCFLLWKPDFKGDVKENYKKAIAHGIKYNVQIIGSSIAGVPNNYEELTDKWMVDLVHNAKMIMHPYTFDTKEQLKKYANLVDGVFTNRADLALDFYGRNPKFSNKVLIDLGYK
jgi:glycerophosphoryl diester phosphodiesterase